MGMAFSHDGSLLVCVGGMGLYRVTKDREVEKVTDETNRSWFSVIDDSRLKLADDLDIALDGRVFFSEVMVPVMRDGEHVITDDTSNFDRDKIISAMVGRSLSDELHGTHKERKIRRAGEKVLSVQNLSMQNIVRNTSFSVFSGQITGIFGLIGSGRTEAAKVVADVMKRNLFHGGQVRLNGKPVRYRVPRPAVRDGIIYVTEDRKTEGFFETISIVENIYLGALTGGRSSARGVNMREMKTIAEEWIRALSVLAINGDARVIELSGVTSKRSSSPRLWFKTQNL